MLYIIAYITRTEVCKVTTCDNTTDPQDRSYPTMTLISNLNCLNDDVQARIDSPPIPIFKAEVEEEKSSNIIKFNMYWNPA